MKKYRIKRQASECYVVDKKILGIFWSPMWVDGETGHAWAYSSVAKAIEHILKDIEIDEEEKNKRKIKQIVGYYDKKGKAIR